MASTFLWPLVYDFDRRVANRTAADAVTGCGHVMMMMHGNNVTRPAETEFGTGPRASKESYLLAYLGRRKVGFLPTLLALFSAYKTVAGYLAGHVVVSLLF
jgi:hypothetical protein